LKKEKGYKSSPYNYFLRDLKLDGEVGVRDAISTSLRAVADEIICWIPVFRVEELFEHDLTEIASCIVEIAVLKAL
jgi:hypothetical protein